MFVVYTSFSLFFFFLISLRTLQTSVSGLMTSTEWPIAQRLPDSCKNDAISLGALMILPNMCLMITSGLIPISSLIPQPTKGETNKIKEKLCV